MIKCILFRKKVDGVPVLTKQGLQFNLCNLRISDQVDVVVVLLMYKQKVMQQIRF
jgi:hypothetical protein